MLITCEICGGSFDCNHKAYAITFGYTCSRFNWKKHQCFCWECYLKKAGLTTAKMFRCCMPVTRLPNMDKIC